MKQAISDSLKLINYFFERRVRKVVVKPNLCYYWDCSTGPTTDPWFVSDLTNLIREQTADDVDISIVESDASAMYCKYAFRMLGFEKLAKQKNINLVNLSEIESDQQGITCNGNIYNFSVPQIIRALI